MKRVNFEIQTAQPEEPPSEDSVTEAMDFALRGYGATPEQVAALQEAVGDRYLRLRRSGKLRTVAMEELRGLLEEASLF